MMAFAYNKPKFVTLFNCYQLDIWTLSMKTQLAPVIIQAMLVDIGVTRSVAEKVIEGLNEMRGTHYTVDDVRFGLLVEESQTAIS